MLYISLLYVIYRIFDFIVSYFSPNFLPFLSNFSYPTALQKINLPLFIKSFANFDGIFYLRIAKQSYSQFEHAFFPLFPILINKLSFIFNNNLFITGFVISNLCFLLGLLIFKKYLDKILKNKKAVFWTLLFFIFFPTSFFFGSVYTEGLFFLFAALVFYLLDIKKGFLAAIVSVLASLTRFVGIFLFIPFLFYSFSKSNKKQQIKLWFYSLFPFIGLVIYSIYLKLTINDPFAFFTSQEAFQAGRSTKLILFPQVIYRYIKIFLTADWNFQYFVAILEFLFFVFFITILTVQLYKLIKEKIKNIPLLSLSTFSLINLLIPTATGTFLSIPRFSLLSLSVFIFLGMLKNKWVKILLLTLFIFLHIILLMFFIRGYFIA
jgi:Gpi18-like mannosyltransferase